MGDQVQVRERARVGARTVVGRGSQIDNDAVVGEGCRIQTGCYVTAYSVLEDDVFLGPGVFTYNDNTMARHDAEYPIIGPTIRRAARVGGGARILPGIEIGEEAFVATGAVVTRDVPGLFSLIAGTLAAHDVNIMSAQIHTREDGVAIDTFQVSDGSGDPVTGTWHWARTLDDLRATLTGEQPVDDLLVRRRRTGRQPQAVPGPPKITVDNRLSDAYTVVEVKCPDRVGLLYLITKTLSGLDLDIASARIATEIDQAVDSFYVLARQGQQREHPAAMERAREGLEQGLVQPL